MFPNKILFDEDAKIVIVVVDFIYPISPFMVSGMREG